MLGKQRLIAAALFSLYLLRCGSAWCAAAPATLHWQTSLEDAKRIASQTNRLVLVHFWSPSCKPCVELDNKVFSQPQVQQFIDARFVPIKINADDAPTTTKRYGIVQLPTDLILTPGAQIVGRMSCPLAADAYMQQLLIASTAPAPSTVGNPGYAANVNAAIAQPRVAALNPAPVAAAPVASPPPAVGYSGQWTAQKSNAAVEQAYSDNRYSEYYQRYSTPPATPQASPASPYPGAAPQNNYAAGTIASPNSNWGGQNMPMNSAPYSSPGPQLSMPSNYAAAPATPYSPPSTGAAPSLGLEGYSPVTLLEQGKWQLGDRRFGAIHRGRTYLFNSPDEQQRFLAEPDRYSPTASGDDVVMAVDYGQEVPGTRSFGLVYQNRMYLFSSEATQRAFLQNRDRYAGQVIQAENLGRNSIR
jgi:thiol-disulfide isomerase/thioredoxin/YHS domain-containing protein